MRLLLVLLLTTTSRCFDLGADDPIDEPSRTWLNSLFYIPDVSRVRKEYRMLSDQERIDLHDAFKMLKEDQSVSPNKYDLLASLHSRRSSRNSAHVGTGFLGWHRVYVLLMENALREKKPNVTLAYWDCTMDAVLAKPNAAATWSEDFLGNGHGYVTSGVFTYWTTQKGHLYRRLGKSGNLLTQDDINRFLSHDHISDISHPRAKYKHYEDNIEETHNHVHKWIGGEMKVIETAAEDPVFFLYHSFISYIWEMFRANQRRRGIDPTTDWDQYFGHMRHNRYSPMGLGNLMAQDGSSDIFSENIVFADRPRCSKNTTDCFSPHLYCNISVGRCVPWTIVEYNAIKQATMLSNSTFQVEAEIAARLKVMEGLQNIGSGANNITAHGEEDSIFVEGKNLNETEINTGDADIAPSNTSTTHPGVTLDDRDTEADEPDHEHDHSVTIANNDQNGYSKEETVAEFIATYLTMLILAVLLLVRVIVFSISKCISESKRDRRKSGRSYNTDGHVDRAHGGDADSSKEETSDMKVENQRRSLYTVTVTSSNPDTGGTFVRFATLGKNRDDMVETLQVDQEEEEGEDNKTGIINECVDLTYASRGKNSSESENTYETIGDMKVIDELFGDITSSEDYKTCRDAFTVDECKAIGNISYGAGEVSNNMKSDWLFDQDDYDKDIFDDYDNIEFKIEALQQQAIMASINNCTAKGT